MATVMLLDGNWLINRAYHVAKQRKEWEPIVVKTVVSWVCEYAVLLEASHLCFCIDGDKVFRHQVYSEYKGNRLHKDNSDQQLQQPLNRQVDAVTGSHSNPAYGCLDELKTTLTKLGLPWLQEEELEADDLLISGSNHLSKQNHKVYMVTLDKDVNQGIKENVIKFVPGVGGKPNKFLRLADLEKSDLGLHGRGLVDYQTLIGDGTDGIPSIVGPATAKKLLHVHGTLPNYFKTKEGKAFWLKNQQELIRNQTLVRLQPDAWAPSLAELKVSPKDKNPRNAPKIWYDLIGCIDVGSRRKKLF